MSDNNIIQLVATNTVTYSVMGKVFKLQLSVKHNGRLNNDTLDKPLSANVTKTPIVNNSKNNDNISNKRIFVDHKDCPGKRLKGSDTYSNSKTNFDEKSLIKAKTQLSQHNKIASIKRNS